MRPLTPALLTLVAVVAAARLAAQADATPPVSPASPSASPTAAASAPSTPAATAAPADSSSLAAGIAIPAPLASPPAPRARAMSPEVAARLSEKMPKFSPAPAPTASDSPIVQAPPPESRETDKPLNTIFRLDPYQVIEAKPPKFKERELLTPKGRLDLALKRYPGLKFGNFWIFNNNGIALMMLEEDLAIERRHEMMELMSLSTFPSERTKVRDQLYDLQVNSRR